MYNLLISASVLLTSIYSLHFTDIEGNQINMSAYQHKKILLVNIATGSTQANQLTGLQQLHQTYGDSLVIIAFPSNSFGNESKTNAEIKQYCQNQHGVTFKIASKNAVTGGGIQSIYNWLSSKISNGMMDAVLTRDFQKFLIDTDGKLIGAFGGSVLPTDSQLINAITGN